MHLQQPSQQSTANEREWPLKLKALSLPLAQAKCYRVCVCVCVNTSAASSLPSTCQPATLLLTVCSAITRQESFVVLCLATASLHRLILTVAVKNNTVSTVLDPLWSTLTSTFQSRAARCQLPTPPISLEYSSVVDLGLLAARVPRSVNTASIRCIYPPTRSPAPTIQPQPTALVVVDLASVPPQKGMVRCNSERCSTANDKHNPSRAMSRNCACGQTHKHAGVAFP